MVPAVEAVDAVLVVLPVQEPVVEASVPGPPAVDAVEPVLPPVVVTKAPVLAEESKVLAGLPVSLFEPPHPITIAAMATQIKQITYVRVFIRLFSWRRVVGTCVKAACGANYSVLYVDALRG